MRGWRSQGQRTNRTKTTTQANDLVKPKSLIFKEDQAASPNDPGGGAQKESAATGGNPGDAKRKIKAPLSSDAEIERASEIFADQSSDFLVSECVAQVNSVKGALSLISFADLDDSIARYTHLAAVAITTLERVEAILTQLDRRHVEGRS